MLLEPKFRTTRRPRARIDTYPIVNVTSFCEGTSQTDDELVRCEAVGNASRLSVREPPPSGLWMAGEWRPSTASFGIVWPVRPSARPSARPSVRLSVRPSARPSARLSVRLSARPPSRPSSRSPARPSARPSSRPSSRPLACPPARLLAYLPAHLPRRAMSQSTR